MIIACVLVLDYIPGSGGWRVGSGGGGGGGGGGLFPGWCSIQLLHKTACNITKKNFFLP